MKRLIEYGDKLDIVCDNPECDFSINVNRNSLLYFVDTVCPKCGENILTIEDYMTYKKLMYSVEFINKRFGWLSIFFRKPKNKKEVMVYTHKGIKVEDVNGEDTNANKNKSNENKI